MNSSKLRRAAALLVIMVALAVSSCAVTRIGGAPETTSFRLTGAAVIIRSDFGSVEVVPVPPTGGPDHEVRITRWFEVEKTAGDAHAEWAKEGDDTIRLGGVCSGVIIDCRLRHRIEVPADLPVKIKAESGSVVASQFTAPLEIDVSEGNINLDRVSGPVELATSNGSMRAERLTSERVAAKAVDGYVILEFDRPPADVATRSTRGNTTIRLPAADYRVKTDLSSAKSTITVGQDADSEHRIAAKVSDGKLRVEPV
ncbi:DUF4097 family beta strand repeat-containing protein [Microlunatus speluncae]|uniref:DUF4097 family beta strand repeat-containing protein n=1 Tax=Microlunatus speluncae TaxID=2594267 RepID=UPI001266405D|nr:DUF4097 family beta strand repeat-containing protein [Microlunatus speluncae]